MSLCRHHDFVRLGGLLLALLGRRTHTPRSPISVHSASHAGLSLTRHIRKNQIRLACLLALLRPNPHPRSAASLSLADSDPLRHLQCAPGDPSKVQEAETTHWCALGVRTVASGVPLGASDVAEPVASIFACLCPPSCSHSRHSSC